VIGAVSANAINTIPAGVREDTEEGVNLTNALRQTWLPNCRKGIKTDAEIDQCGGSCFNSTLITTLESFFLSSNFELVSFNSRAGPEGQDVVQIKAWWIPPASGIDLGTGTPPRVVVCHGMEQNQNKFEAQLAAYFLASLGFGVLLPSLRDHGLSGESSHGLLGFGWEYPYDLLGAWDYARNDPDGLLGGAIPPDQVGLMGFSMGGFTTMNAFGVEHEVPAVWTDAAMFSVKNMLLKGMREQVGPLADLSIEFAWAFANSEVELHHNNPADLLPTGPDTQRKVYLAQNPYDNAVPMSEAENYIDVLMEHPEKYEVSAWFLGSYCNGDAHRITTITHASEYQKRLCFFWTDVFGVSDSHCAMRG